MNIDSFGAKGDGTTDDSAAIQTALNQGGTLRFTAGKTYALGTKLTASISGTTLIGYGATLKQLDGKQQGAVLEIAGQSGNKVSNVTLIGLSIDANYGGQPGGNQPRGVAVKYAQDILIDSIRVRNAWVSVDLGIGAKHCSVRNCIVTQYYNDGFETSGTAANNEIDKPCYIEFIGCHAYDKRTASDNAWEIEDGAHHITVVGCFAPDGAIGIRNHSIPEAQTQNITVSASTFLEMGIANTYDTQTNFVRNIMVIGSYGIVSTFGIITNLHMVPALLE